MGDRTATEDLLDRVRLGTTMVTLTRVRVDRARIDRYRDAAAAAEMSMSQWILASFDEAHDHPG